MIHFPNCTLRLESFEQSQLADSVAKVISLVNEFNLNIDSCVFLPTKRRVITLLRSPHIDKKSREQFETRIYRRLLTIQGNNPDKLDSFITALKNSLPVAISVRIKFFNYESK